MKYGYATLLPNSLPSISDPSYWHPSLRTLDLVLKYGNLYLVSTRFVVNAFHTSTFDALSLFSLAGG